MAETESQRLLNFFTYGHLPEDLQAASEPCSDIAHMMAMRLPDGPELAAGLRHLVEAKDCFVRAVVEEKRKNP